MALGRTVAACWHVRPSRCCPARSRTGLCRTAPTLQHSSRSRALCSYKADSGAQQEPQQPRLPQLPQPQLVEGKDLQLLELKFERRQDQVVNAVDRVEKELAEVKKDVAEVKKDVADVKKDVAEVRLLLISFAVLVVAIFGYKELLPLGHVQTSTVACQQSHVVCAA